MRSDLEKELSERVVTDKKLSNDSLYVVTIPHSSSYVPFSILENFNIDSSFVNEIDIYTDKIYSLENHGADVLVFNLHRYVMDVNRSPANIFPKKTFSNKNIRKKDLSEEERKILQRYYRDYYKAVETSMHNVRGKYGMAFLLNGHSMEGTTPAFYDKTSMRPSFCVGHPGNNNNEFANHLQEALFYLSREFVHDSSLKLKDILINKPFKANQGITPYFNRERDNYRSVLVEVNQDLYIDGDYKVNQEKVLFLNNVMGIAVKEVLAYLK